MKEKRKKIMKELEELNKKWIEIVREIEAIRIYKEICNDILKSLKRKGGWENEKRKK
jgi:hypothetical protein